MPCITKERKVENVIECLNILLPLRETLRIWRDLHIISWQPYPMWSMTMMYIKVVRDGNEPKLISISKPADKGDEECYYVGDNGTTFVSNVHKYDIFKVVAEIYNQ